jgi:hypothetical protein
MIVPLYAGPGTGDDVYFRSSWLKGVYSARRTTKSGGVDAVPTEPSVPRRPSGLVQRTGRADQTYNSRKRLLKIPSGRIMAADEQV